MGAASEYPFLVYLRTGDQVNTPQAQLVQSLIVASRSRVVQFILHDLCYYHDMIEVAITATR